MFSFLLFLNGGSFSAPAQSPHHVKSRFNDPLADTSTRMLRLFFLPLSPLFTRSCCWCPLVKTASFYPPGGLGILPILPSLFFFPDDPPPSFATYSWIEEEGLSSFGGASKCPEIFLPLLSPPFSQMILFCFCDLISNPSESFGSGPLPRTFFFFLSAFFVFL